jgi:hypothetical protein
MDSMTTLPSPIDTILTASSTPEATVKTVKWLVKHSTNEDLRSMADCTATWYALAFWYVDEDYQLNIDRKMNEKYIRS